MTADDDLRRVTLTVDVSTDYHTPEGVIANWRKLTKDVLIDQLCVYHEGMAALAARSEPRAERPGAAGMSAQKYVCRYCGFRLAAVYLLPNGGAICRNHEACMKRRKRAPEQPE